MSADWMQGVWGRGCWRGVHDLAAWADGWRSGGLRCCRNRSENDKLIDASTYVYNCVLTEMVMIAIALNLYQRSSYLYRSHEDVLRTESLSIRGCSMWELTPTYRSIFSLDISLSGFVWLCEYFSVKALTTEEGWHLSLFLFMNKSNISIIGISISGCLCDCASRPL